MVKKLDFKPVAELNADELNKLQDDLCKSIEVSFYEETKQELLDRLTVYRTKYFAFSCKLMGWADKRGEESFLRLVYLFGVNSDYQNARRPVGKMYLEAK